MAPSKRTLRSRWLGQSLRELRDDTGLTLVQAGEYLQRNASTVNRFESGEFPIRRPDLMALMDLYQLSDQRRRDGLLRLSEESWQTGWWDGHPEDMNREFVDFVWLEQRAARIRSFDPMLVTGMVQTREYARAVISAADWEADAAQVDRWTDLRMQRQHAVLHRADPPEVTVILDEPVLRRRIGGPDVHRVQLGHLLTCAALPHVDLRVLPAEVGAHASPTGTFQVFDIAEPDMTVGYAETLGGAIYVEPPASERFVRVYDRLLHSALDPAGSAERIRRILEE